jgi:predicted metal-dependent hydrolase
MSHTISINNDDLPIIIRKHSTSRRMVLRYQPLQHQISLTLPRYVSLKKGLHFVEEKRDWLTQQINEKSPQIPFVNGQVIPVLGKDYTLRHVGGRGTISVTGNEILIHGDESFMKRRLLDWLKRQAKQEISAIADFKGKMIHKSVGKISLRDTSSRWGSCSHEGNLSFSWRLVFAPYEVLYYVVCHEVAHIEHHNHSHAFWKAVHLLCPNYESYRDWLKIHGHKLYTYG